MEKVDLPKLDISNVSFIVNTKKCGSNGEVRCTARHPDGSQAPVKYEYLDESIYRVKIFPLKTGIMHLRFEHWENEIIKK
ncbi:hypothetical protein BpHYR1_018140 [Brachionus plicatilis]|uniref:Uncharacterized protein n=1 Tax=Brachionus plicatilis TaxID=10195 RepID=A0A3M7P4D3_BRAPC|nr:hypothetical protein BpHYR1_018140 [Brachionus plicatilis]